MPWVIVPDDGKYCVHKENSDGSPGEKLKCYDSKPEAEDYMRALYANEGKTTLAFFGDSVKAIGSGKVAGYLVRFGEPKQTDLQGDFFNKDTDFGVVDGGNLPVFYQHGFDGVLKTRKLGLGTIKYDDVGLWFEAQLELRDEYEKMIYELVERGKMGWSSGAASHLVEREPVGKSYYVKSWIIAEASLTPTPAEPQNEVVPVKSLFEPVETVDTGKAGEEQTQSKQELKMEADELKTLMEEVAERSATEAVKKYADSHKPDAKAGFDLEVVGDEADRALMGNPFKTGAEFFTAVKNAAIAPHSIDKRLLPLKATGLNEAIPSQGGFLVTQDIASGILEQMWGTGSLLARFPALKISGNGIVMNAIDETSRANGSRGGGVLGYWLAEGGTKTASKPKFRQIELKLKKVAALCYATDELLDDAMAVESWLSRYVPVELRFQVENSIINGTGVGMPLGILQSGALVQAVRTDASEIDSLDITRMWSLRYAGANDYVWLINQNVTPQLYNMSIGNSPIFLPPGGIADSPYARLLGRPVIETEYNPGLGTLGDIMLISPSQYALIDKGGVQAASSIHVQFVTDETAFRFVYRVDGAPMFYSGVTAFNSTDTLSPFVALAAST